MDRLLVGPGLHLQLKKAKISQFKALISISIKARRRIKRIRRARIKNRIKKKNQIAIKSELWLLQKITNSIYQMKYSLVILPLTYKL